MSSSPTDDGGAFIMYQQQGRDQILLYDLATSYSVLAYLKMKHLKTVIKNRSNTEFMSENGRMPVVFESNHDKPLCGFGELYWHLAKRAGQTPPLMELAYMDWVESNFLLAEMYTCWCQEQTVEKYTRPRYTHELPWPVSTILFNRKQKQMQVSVGQRLASYDDMLENFDQFLSKLDRRLRNKTYCLSDTSPSSVDALIYGHTSAILNTANIDPRLINAITKHRRIDNLARLINQNYPS